MINLSNRLTQLRKDAKLTQKQLGELLDVCPSTVAMYETNQRVPRLDKAKEIADLFNVPIEEIFYETSSLSGKKTDNNLQSALNNA